MELVNFENKQLRSETVRLLHLCLFTVNLRKTLSIMMKYLFTYIPIPKPIHTYLHTYFIW